MLSCSRKTKRFDDSEGMGKICIESLMGRPENNESKNTRHQEDKGNIVSKGIDGVEIALGSLFVGPHSIKIIWEDALE